MTSLVLQVVLAGATDDTMLEATRHGIPASNGGVSGAGVPS